MKMRIFLTCFLCYIFSSCTTDDLTGEIVGMVRDYNTGAPIANCEITLTPGKQSVLTGDDGLFSFSNLTQSNYTITVKKSGYNEETQRITVIPGQSSTVSIALKATAEVVLSESNYDFGDFSYEKSFVCYNNSDGQCSYQIKDIPDWVKLNKTSGTLQPGGNDSFVVTIDRSKVEDGTHHCDLLVAYSGNVSGTQTLRLTMKKVQLSIPTVTIASSATNITKEGFEIQGTITATGGAQVLEYGHCWSQNPMPTIDDYHKNHGKADNITSFTTNVTGLSQNTTYYVRAYAKNALGVAYTDPILVTTQTTVSDKWDGTKAKSFAGGSGTKTDPYRIKTGAQLVLLKDYKATSDISYFELSNDIDLNNIAWPEINLEYFELDGKGHTIYNLRITRSGDNLGLFAEIDDARIKNLTINGVNINSSTSNYVGAFAGSAVADFKNCSVIFNENSIIKGKDNVGGICGNYSKERDGMEECSVEKSAPNNGIIGNNYVGGIAGFSSGNTPGNITGCCSSVDISGANSVGGLFGYSYSNISNCYYDGRIEGRQYVGGIAGSGDGNIIASKSNASITASYDYVGGITGDIGGHIDVYACYADGFIACESNSAQYIGGISGWGSCYHCYSTVNSYHQNFDGLSYPHYYYVTECATTASSKVLASENALNCVNITQAMKQFDSEYAEYFNFNNTWTWTGEVNGKTRNVSCPKLYWE